MKERLTSSLVLMLTLLVPFYVSAQLGKGIEFIVQGGVSIPNGDLTKTGKDGLGVGMAKTGLDFSLGTDVLMTNYLTLGAKFNYSFYNIDQSAVNDLFLEKWEKDSEITTSPYQNLAVLAGVSYVLPIYKDKLEWQPYLYGGINFFKSALVEARIPQVGGGSELSFSKETDVAPAFVINPGMAFNLELNDFMYFRVYGEFMGSNPEVNENVNIDNPTSVSYTRKVAYNLTALHTGGGVLIRF